MTGANSDRLAYMANQIARNLAAQGAEAAINATAEHFAKFWDPRMKQGLLALDPAHLDPIAREAAARLAVRMEHAREA